MKLTKVQPFTEEPRQAHQGAPSPVKPQNKSPPLLPNLAAAWNGGTDGEEKVGTEQQPPEER